MSDTYLIIQNKFNIHSCRLYINAVVLLHCKVIRSVKFPGIQGQELVFASNALEDSETQSTHLSD
jgi:hypothetical protein